MMNAKDKTKLFLEVASQFNLGHLTTEGFHSKTLGLSQLVKKDVSLAHELLQQVDADALFQLINREEQLWDLSQQINSTLKSGHRVFMCGCGATGRLSLVLETLHHQKFGITDQVVSFMAGGDYALIKSVESFEDRMDYGERQLKDLGFGPHDLLLASTEGGETPFVIGAANAAAKISTRSPYFLYCNPDDQLNSIDRSREIIANTKITKLNLTVGPMAISGSTRMQASTVLMLSIGVGLLYRHQSRSDFSHFFKMLLAQLTSISYEALAPLTAKEAKLYQDGKYLNYISDPRLAISILTDTTERSPTFSLQGFENTLYPTAARSLSYLFVAESEDALKAWQLLLFRSPRALDWKELGGAVDINQLVGFDISLKAVTKRSELIATEDFVINHGSGKTTFRILSHEVSFETGDDPLIIHLIVKMLLNAHSTLIMGLLGRYEGNVMTYVRPSNNKLIDRAARYILQLLSQKNKQASYEDVVEKIFEEIETASEGAVVLRVVERY
jgi:N-acetylmuramic acid 6-phosphate etherase